MAFQAVPDTVEIDVIYTLHGVLVQNVFYAEFSGGYALANLTALATQIDAAMAAAWLSDQPAEAVYLRTEVRGLAFQNDLAVTNNTSTGPGTETNAALPGNVTFSVKKTSGLTGRSARGRCYWIGIPRDKVKSANENELQTAYAALIAGNVDHIKDVINGTTGWAAVLVSRFTGGALRPFGVTFPWIGTIAVDEVVDTQRKRLS